MSDRLQIKFAADMPAATVEVVAPDLATVERVWLAPGQQKTVQVPSEASFLRIHLTSGEIVTLQDPGNLDRVISKRTLAKRLYHPLEMERLRILGPRDRGPRGMPTVPVVSVAELAGELKVRLLSSQGAAQPGELRGVARNIVFQPPMKLKPYTLAIDTPEMQLRVRIPGMIEELSVRSGVIRAGKRSVSIRVRTRSSTADAISAYINRGDLHSAVVLTDWAEKAEDLFEEKNPDPFAAAVGAYLLLRLRRFELLHDWTRNLANWFPDVSDGSIIWAWHQIQQGGQEAQIHEYLHRALEGSLPVFTEGLQLLSDGVRLLRGEDRRQAMDTLNQRSGLVLWGSPFAATMHRTGERQYSEVEFDIDYASRL